VIEPQLDLHTFERLFEHGQGVGQSSHVAVRIGDVVGRDHRTDVTGSERGLVAGKRFLF
jgi:hypothetical protein